MSQSPCMDSAEVGNPIKAIYCITHLGRYLTPRAHGHSLPLSLLFLDKG
jgi:hypothetical protein